MDFRKKFKKFGGTYIPDIIEYLKEYLEKDPTLTISLGCDSVQRRRKTMYAITLMLYNSDIKNGAHIIFFRDVITKVRDNFERLHKEAQYVHEVAEFLQAELEPFYNRKDLTDQERRRYKYHVGKCNGDYVNVYDEDNFIKRLTLTDEDMNSHIQIIDLHLDFNPIEGKIDGKGYAKNKSNLSYKAYVPWLRGLGYRVWAKPNSHAATEAAELLLK